MFVLLGFAAIIIGGHFLIKWGMRKVARDAQNGNQQGPIGGA